MTVAEAWLQAPKHFGGLLEASEMAVTGMPSSSSPAADVENEGMPVEVDMPTADGRRASEAVAVRIPLRRTPAWRAEEVDPWTSEEEDVDIPRPLHIRNACENVLARDDALAAQQALERRQLDEYFRNSSAELQARQHASRSSSSSCAAAAEENS